MHVRKGDTVEVIAGKDLGKQGKVLEVQPHDARALVEKINLAYKHQRPGRANKPGGITQLEAPIHVSNLMVVCTECGKPGRRRMMEMADGRRVRVCRSCGEVLDKR